MLGLELGLALGFGLGIGLGLGVFFGRENNKIGCHHCDLRSEIWDIIIKINIIIAINDYNTKGPTLVPIDNYASLIPNPVLVLHFGPC